MRPRSIIGPLLLILVGALFLVNNLHPGLPWVDLVSKYWPYLLIAWGALVHVLDPDEIRRRAALST